jgi:hypothetical protein
VKRNCSVAELIGETIFDRLESNNKKLFISGNRIEISYIKKKEAKHIKICTIVRRKNGMHES